MMEADIYSKGWCLFTKIDENKSLFDHVISQKTVIYVCWKTTS
jgi:hypothetical protein